MVWKSVLVSTIYTVVALARDLRTYRNADHPSCVAFRLCASIGRASTERQYYPSARVTRPLLTHLMLSSPQPYQRTESSYRVVAGANLQAEVLLAIESAVVRRRMASRNFDVSVCCSLYLLWRGLEALREWAAPWAG